MDAEVAHYQSSNIRVPPGNAGILRPGSVNWLGWGEGGTSRTVSFIFLPFSYLFFEDVVLTYFPYNAPVRVAKLFIGLPLVLAIAFLMIGSQAIKAARRNSAEVLKSEHYSSYY